jgi:hypothetical protein
MNTVNYFKPPPEAVLEVHSFSEFSKMIGDSGNEDGHLKAWIKSFPYL